MYHDLEVRESGTDASVFSIMKHGAKTMAWKIAVAADPFGLFWTSRSLTARPPA